MNELLQALAARRCRPWLNADDPWTPALRVAGGGAVDRS